jgi:hypothetical protein
MIVDDVPTRSRGEAAHDGRATPRSACATATTTLPQTATTLAAASSIDCQSRALGIALG